MYRNHLKNLILAYEKNHRNLEIEKDFLLLINDIYKITIGSIIPNGEILNALLLISRMK